MDITGGSSYQSRLLLTHLCTTLATGALDRMLCTLAANSINPNQLDLSKPDVKSLANMITDIDIAYKADFTQRTTQVNCGSTGTTTSMNDVNITVQLQEEALSEQGYQAELQRYNDSVAQFEDTKLEAFVAAKITLMIHKGDDVGALKRKVEKVPLIHEPRPKVFVDDYMCFQSFDPDSAATCHHSIYDPMKLTLGDDPTNMLLSMYAAFKTNDERRESADIIVVIVPGAPPNSPENATLKLIHKGLTRSVPKLQAPNIGSIVLSPTELLQRTKAKTAFSAYCENLIVFTKENKNVMPRMLMQVLGGHLF